MEFCASIFAFLAVAVLLTGSVQSKSCVWDAPNGKRYDFNSLKKTGDSYEGTEPPNFQFYLNFCTDAISSTCSGSTGFMSYEYFVGGAGCTGIVPSSKMPSFEFKNGDNDEDGIVIKFSGATKSFYYEIKCGDKLYPSTPISVTLSGTVYKASGMYSSAACGVYVGFKSDDEGGLTGGTYFLIAFFGALAVYVGSGVAYNMTKKKLRGKEALPNVEFWTKSFGYVKDGCNYSWGKTRELFGCSAHKLDGGGSYESTN